MKEQLKALDHTRILAPVDLRQLVSFLRYGRLKLELLWDLISLCRFWALLKGHNYEQIYKGQQYYIEYCITVDTVDFVDIVDIVYNETNYGYN